MIGATGDMTNQYLVRANYSDSADQRAVVRQENDILKVERPVETAGDGSRTEADMKHGTTDKYELEDSKIVFKKYDKNGHVIYRVPPELINEDI